MVCVPCFLIPVLLYIWHRFIQPIVLRYWNPWQKKDADGNVIQAGPQFPFQCKGGVCPFPGAKGNTQQLEVAGEGEKVQQDTNENNTQETTGSLISGDDGNTKKEN